MRVLVRIFIFALLLCGGRVYARSFSIENMKQSHAKLLTKPEFRTDKQKAVLEFYTKAKGFKFQCAGKEVTPEEGDGVLTLLLPHKAKSLLVSHEKYGFINWKFPVGKLKKKKNYTATIVVDDPGEEYILSKQWAVLYINPKNSVVYLDSSYYAVRNGVLSVNLDTGKHAVKVVAPFYKTYEDSIEIADTVRTEKSIFLDPQFAYFSLMTNVEDAVIKLNGNVLGEGWVEKEKVSPGRYFLSVEREGFRSHFEWIDIQPGEKEYKNIKLLSGSSEVQITGEEDVNPLSDMRLSKKDSITASQLQLHIRPLGKVTLNLNGVKITDFSGDYSALLKPGFYELKLEMKGYRPFMKGFELKEKSKISIEKELERVSAPTIIKAVNDETDIWINRTFVGKGTWEGKLSAGFYSISTTREAMESEPYFLWVDMQDSITLDMATPQGNYGFLEIKTNVVDADVYINGLRAPVAKTPCVIRNLPKYKSYKITIKKEGYHTMEKKLYLKANDIITLEFNLKELLR